jgi:hypothetical protein
MTLAPCARAGPPRSFVIACFAVSRARTPRDRWIAVEIAARSTMRRAPAPVSASFTDTWRPVSQPVAVSIASNSAARAASGARVIACRIRSRRVLARRVRARTASSVKTSARSAARVAVPARFAAVPEAAAPAVATSMARSSASSAPRSISLA